MTKSLKRQVPFWAWKASLLSTLEVEEIVGGIAKDLLCKKMKETKIPTPKKGKKNQKKMNRRTGVIMMRKDKKIRVKNHLMMKKNKNKAKTKENSQKNKSWKKDLQGVETTEEIREADKMRRKKKKFRKKRK